MRRNAAFTAAATLLIILAGGLFFFLWGLRPHQDAIYEYSRLYRVDPFLALAVAEVESGFDEQAVSKKGAVGLMQLMPVTAAEEARDAGLSVTGPSGLADPRLNIALGVHHLKRLSQQYNGDPVRTLAAYNAGTASVKAWLGKRNDLAPSDIPYAETRHFVKKVLFLRRLLILAGNLKLIPGSTSSPCRAESRHSPSQ